MSFDPASAVGNPAETYASPEELAADGRLDAEQKIAALRQWAYDVREAEVAVEEGMPGDEGDVLRRILLALAGLGHPADADHVAPTKQHPFTD